MEIKSLKTLELSPGNRWQKLAERQGLLVACHRQPSSTVRSVQSIFQIDWNLSPLRRTVHLRWKGSHASSPLFAKKDPKWDLFLRCGEAGIRTLGTLLQVQLLSRQLPSATRPPLQTSQIFHVGGLVVPTT